MSSATSNDGLGEALVEAPGAEPGPERRRAFLVRANRWFMRAGMARRFAIALAAAAVASGISTYLAMSGSAPFETGPHIVLFLLNVDLVLLLLLGAVVAHRLVRLWIERRRGSAGSRVQTRLVTLFGVVAVTPAILVSVFSALFLDLGLQSWFSQQVRHALEESSAVAQSYLKEHREGIRADVLAMASDINRQAPQLMQNSAVLSQLVSRLAELRGLSEALVLTRDGRVMAQDGLTFALGLERIPETAMQQAEDGETVILGSETEDRVRAVVRLDRFVDGYLFVGRFIEPGVLDHVRNVETTVTNYKLLETKRSGIEITFVMIFVVVALLILLAAIWVGLVFANKLVSPVGALIAAAERVRGGDLGARVEEGAPGDEIGSLSRAFNRMTGQLESQRSELVSANRQLDARRRFSEAVLEGVSAGVLGLDPDRVVNLANRSALALLGLPAERLIGQRLDLAIPEMAALLNDVQPLSGRTARAQIELKREGRTRTFNARVVTEIAAAEVKGFVVTLDDISALVAAQRTAAWADVARRIAHEIKNPLTPIQLSAERLKRKYLREIQSEPEIFTACTDTIVRQVGDIRQMVDEFSAFARMPAPVMRVEDLAALARQALLLQRMANPDIVYEPLEHAGVAAVECDSRQVGQAITNLLKNAAEAIRGREARAGGEERAGRIWTRIEREGERALLIVEDDGPGLPAENRDRLTEPYVTTREKGTGLGLAIVKKIMEDHGGELILGDRPGGGARIGLAFIARGDNASRPERILSKRSA
jgi:two-component system nitrogen regulation sensor histidine kinase NtrY